MTSVCFCATNSILQEPRFRRYALEFARRNPATCVFVLDCAATPLTDEELNVFRSEPNVVLRRAVFASKRSGFFGLALSKISVGFARLLYRVAGHVGPSVLSMRAAPLLREMKRVKADVFCVYTMDALLPAFICAERAGSSVAFDSMEYYADMGDGQTAREKAVTGRILSGFLPRCTMVFASSQVLAERLQAEYRVKEVVALYNCPKRTAIPLKVAGSFLRLYWRNAVVALGQRGLGVLLQALTRLPEDVVLTVRGRLPLDEGEHVFRKIASLGLVHRVTVLPPHAVEDGVIAAQEYDIGVCPESAGPLNHDMTVSNKMFDFLAAGLAVVSSDLAGLRRVIEESAAGLLFAPDDADALAAQIKVLYDDRELLARLSGNASRYHLGSANFESQFERFYSTFLAATKGIEPT